MGEQINLCERLAPVIASEVAEVDRGASSLANASVLKFLHYLSSNHYSAGENLLHSPQALRKMHKLTDKQFTWVALRARASQGAWWTAKLLSLAKAGWGEGKPGVG